MEVKTMAHTIIISYTSVVKPADIAGASICPVMMPTDCAANMSAFDGTYYDTNVEGWGEGTALEAFMGSVVAHPGLVAAVRKAIADGTYTITDATAADALYAGEWAKALADQGITVLVDPAPVTGE